MCPHLELSFLMLNIVVYYKTSVMSFCSLRIIQNYKNNSSRISFLDVLVVIYLFLNECQYLLKMLV